MLSDVLAEVKEHAMEGELIAQFSWQQHDASTGCSSGGLNNNQYHFGGSLF